jgi:hypothetical protein
MGIRSRSAPKNRCARAFGLLRSAAATATVGAHVGCAISCISPFVLQTRDDLLWRQEREDWNCGSPFPSAVGVKRAGFFFFFRAAHLWSKLPSSMIVICHGCYPFLFFPFDGWITGLDTLVPPVSTSTRVVSVADDACVDTNTVQPPLRAEWRGRYCHPSAQKEFCLLPSTRWLAASHFDSCSFVLLHRTDWSDALGCRSWKTLFIFSLIFLLLWVVVVPLSKVYHMDFLLV